MRSDPDDRPERPLPRGGDVLGGPDVFGEALLRWAADAAVDEAARARARQRWLRLQAEEDASIPGTLLDLGERRATVSLRVGASTLRGTIRGLGADFVALGTDGGQHLVIPYDAIEVVRAEPGAEAVAGARSVRLDVTLAGLVGAVAGERPDILVRTRSGLGVRGQLRSASGTVLRIRPDGDARTPTWVALAAVALVVVEP